MRMTPTTYGAFLSTLSLRRATGKLPKPLTDCVFLSTLSLRRATPPLCGLDWLLAHFYPRSPCGERRQHRLNKSNSNRNFYPRSPCGERLCDNTYTLGITDISIHALLAESDVGGRVLFSTPGHISIHALLAESDPHIHNTSHGRRGISIHALLAESDPTICNGISPTR